MIMSIVYDHAGLLSEESYSKVATHPCLHYEPLTKGTYKCQRGIYALEVSTDKLTGPNRTWYQTVIKLPLLKSGLIIMHKALEASFPEEVGLSSDKASSTIEFEHSIISTSTEYR